MWETLTGSGGNMKRKTIAIIGICIFALMLSACEGATSGSVRNSSQTCHNLGGYGDCEGRIGKLSGTYSIEIEDEGISPGDEIVVELSILLELGSLQASILNPDGEETSVEVDPGIPASITGITQGDFDGFEISIRALGESAEGITYSLRYFIQ
jgi:hypothetical protein